MAWGFPSLLVQVHAMMMSVVLHGNPNLPLGRRTWISKRMRDFLALQKSSILWLVLPRNKSPKAITDVVELRLVDFGLIMDELDKPDHVLAIGNGFYVFGGRALQNQILPAYGGACGSMFSSCRQAQFRTTTEKETGFRKEPYYKIILLDKQGISWTVPQSRFGRGFSFSGTADAMRLMLISQAHVYGLGARECTARGLGVLLYHDHIQRANLGCSTGPSQQLRSRIYFSQKDEYLEYVLTLSPFKALGLANQYPAITTAPVLGPNEMFEGDICVRWSPETSQPDLQIPHFSGNCLKKWNETILPNDW
ncbi:hypothetical protein BS47DRAFT_1382195 [Hydnum rufescens UP504]|uniref:Uncharacterized protein n=1 Tax=Hydnum rufescens UP504 TaxID=1448309 RepID=A0A9P6AY47_9AGAM|nr:hypothetical protein BS47DRAFT_1382195 [Hydnum rufescens UP504]